MPSPQGLKMLNDPNLLLSEGQGCLRTKVPQEKNREKQVKEEKRLGPATPEAPPTTGSNHAWIHTS